MLDTLSTRGKGPFEAWAEGRPAQSLERMGDSDLGAAAVDTYGAEVLALLHGAGLSALYARDLGKVLGAQRAGRIAQDLDALAASRPLTLAAEPAEPATKPAHGPLTVRWRVVGRLGAGLCLAMILAAIFAEPLL